mgnify:CR=1 FL=1
MVTRGEFEQRVFCIPSAACQYKLEAGFIEKLACGGARSVTRLGHSFCWLTDAALTWHPVFILPLYCQAGASPRPLIAELPPNGFSGTSTRTALI